MAASRAFETRVAHDFDTTFAPGGEWDQRLAASRANTVFLMSGWLRAWHETLGHGVDLVLPQIRHHGRLVAAAAFLSRNGILEFAGKGPSDCGDLVVSDGLEPSVASDLVGSLVHAARRGARGFRWSMRRAERDLGRRGALTCQTFRDAERILPQLDEFFDQHVRRWQSTEWPSLFLSDDQRAFYRRFTERLDGSGILRFTAVRLDGRLVAAHYGFHHAERFIWYKPSFEPDFAKASPGDFLLKHLVELARNEKADEFDFTIGDEAYKHRFATKNREVVDIYLTDSRMQAVARRLRVRARETGERLIGTDRLNAALRRFRRTIGAPTA